MAAAARAAGIIIYCIGLIGQDGIDVAVLNDWATDPDASHVAVTPNDEDLEQLFADLAANITKPGATQIVIDEVVNPDFAILRFSAPSKGTVKLVDAQTLQWQIPSLGTMANEGASLTFVVQHTGDTSGVKEVNQSITYQDAENNAVTFPTPSVAVDCGNEEHPEPCPTPVNVTMPSCSDSMVVDAGDLYMQSQGRILQVNVNVKNVCPRKRVALAVIVTEVDTHGLEHNRGLKTVTLPAHGGATCRDVLVKCLRFVLPEDLRVSGGPTNSICGTRTFKVRAIAHYVDSDFVCCDQVQ